MEFNMAATATVQSTDQKPHFARVREVSKHFSVSRSTLWGWAKNRADFPKPFRASQRVTLWDINAITAFIKTDAAKSGGTV
jgi:predicted DNA-binding transcriptional regulator AlpA